MGCEGVNDYKNFLFKQKSVVVQVVSSGYPSFLAQKKH